MRRSVTWLAGLLVAVSVWPVAAAELVMFRTAGCPYCARWDREIAPIYDKTEESRRLPLRMIDMSGPRPADLKAIEGVVFSPTFVVVDQGREVGRVTGYTGQDFFWGLLGAVIAKLPTETNGKQHVMTTEGRKP